MAQDHFEVPSLYILYNVRAQANPLSNKHMAEEQKKDKKLKPRKKHGQRARTRPANGIFDNFSY